MIISASRRTDIPAFYFEWFLKRLDEGFFYVRNPMNPRQVSRIDIAPENTDCIVFWTKNPIPAIKRLGELNAYMYYFQYTLNNYPDMIESNLPSFTDRLEAFKELAGLIGKERVIWRYDPIFLTEDIDVKYHLENFEKIAEELQDSTEEVVVSLIDDYRKIRNNMKEIGLRQISIEEEELLFQGMKSISDRFGLRLSSCAETRNLALYGILPGKCIDDELISRLLKQPIIAKKDKNQREQCGCVESMEIGAYNTCTHGCRFCYANLNDNIIGENIAKHDRNSPLLIGDICEHDKITTRKTTNFRKSSQQLNFLD